MRIVRNLIELYLMRSCFIKEKLRMNYLSQDLQAMNKTFYNSKENFVLKIILFLLYLIRNNNEENLHNIFCKDLL